MSDVQKLREQAAAIREKIDRIEAAEKFEVAVKLVGKCFRYRNCYSCPTSDADYWWMYSRVLKATKDGWLVVFRFQTDKYDKIEIEPAARCSTSLGSPISQRQFQHAWKVLARTINHKARDAKAVS